MYKMRFDSFWLCRKLHCKSIKLRKSFVKNRKLFSNPLSTVELDFHQIEIRKGELLEQTRY